MDSRIGAPRIAQGLREGPVSVVDFRVEAIADDDEVVMVVGKCRALGMIFDLF
jgi:hypothetical protein